VSGAFDETGRETVFEGRMIRAGVARFRYDDGEEVSREMVWHPGAVGVLALDTEDVWLTRQPREAAGMADSLEVPAGKLDVPGEPPLETAKRELAEEVGLRADRWEEIFAFYTSPGFSDERVWLYLARDLEPLPEGAQPDDGERIAAVRWPLARLQDAIAACEDSKSLIALLWLTAMQARRR
jgi:8-oxo-dGTP pyrophosphatase MutT (NUDIX family)